MQDLEYGLLLWCAKDVEDELPKKAVSTKLDPKDMPWSTAPEKGNAWT